MDEKHEATEDAINAAHQFLVSHNLIVRRVDDPTDDDRIQASNIVAECCRILGCSMTDLAKGFGWGAPLATSEVDLTIMTGTHGSSAYLNDYRIGGPKPISPCNTKTFTVKIADIEEALKQLA